MVSYTPSKSQLNFLESVMSGSNFQTQGMNNTTSTLSKIFW